MGKGKTLLGIVNKLFVAKGLLTSPSNDLPYYLKKIFPPIIWIFTEGDGIESSQPSKITFTLLHGSKETSTDSNTLGTTVDKT